MVYDFLITYDNDDFTKSFSKELKGTIADVIDFVGNLRYEGFTDICVTCPKEIYRNVDEIIHSYNATATY